MMAFGAAGGAVDSAGTTGSGNWGFIFFLIFILLIFGVGFFSGCI